jgi:hypothetical protein
MFGGAVQMRHCSRCGVMRWEHGICMLPSIVAGTSNVRVHNHVGCERSKQYS